MTVNIKQTLHILIAAALLVLGSSCSKTPIPPDPEIGAKNLSVELDKSYLGSGLVDSAIAVWDINGQQKRVALSNHNDTLSADINQFEAGSGTLTIQVFSKLKFGNSSLSQWLFTQQVAITQKTGLKIAGPKNFSDLHWKPRVELKDGIGNFAVVALRPDDPYFFVKNLSANLKSIVVARDYWKTGGGVFRVGGGEWKCNTNCTNSNGDVENSQFFSFLPAQIGTASWNHIEITILYIMDQWGGGPALMITHTL
ncbi:MAG TPA: hypothetical protein VHN59_05515 [Chitinophagaceae bacterium]|nr:hypothetical protein [Chitinophagaceae bacterium]